MSGEHLEDSAIANGTPTEPYPAGPLGRSRDQEARWRSIGIAAGLVAVIVYPILILVSLPRVPQVVLGASFGPALAVASLALWHVLRSNRHTPSGELAAMCNALAGALVTAMILVQLAINYSTAPEASDQLATVIRDRLWDIVLGLDVSFDVFIGLGTLLFAVNMIRDPRFGRLIGWAGVLVATIPLWGANLFFFPDPPYTHGFPHVGIFTGAWYLGVVLLMIRDARGSRHGSEPRGKSASPASVGADETKR